MTNNDQPLVAKPVVLSVRGMKKYYSSHLVLDGISIEIREGESLAIIGPSGSGKSTFLRCLNQLEPINEGQIYHRGNCIVNGRHLLTNENILRREIGMVFQEYDLSLWNNKNILQNCTEAPRFVLRMKRKEAEKHALEWLQRVGIAECAQKYPAELSGGQKQRTAIARALVMNPTVLLLDEVTSSLDIETTVQLLRLFESLQDGSKTYIYATHHLQFAARHTHRTAVIIDGRIVELGPSKQVIESPQKEETKGFLKLLEEIW